MKPGSVRKPLREAAAKIESAREELAGTGAATTLNTIEIQLRYYLDGDTSDPEARIYPPPGALDSIQARLTDVIEGTDGAAAEHLRSARGHLLEVILALDDRLHEGRPTSGHR